MVRPGCSGLLRQLAGFAPVDFRLKCQMMHLDACACRIGSNSYMIALGTETLLTFSQAASELPRRRQGKGVSTVTLWRWATKGVCGITLETLRTPSGRVTTREAPRGFWKPSRCNANPVLARPGRRHVDIALLLNGNVPASVRSKYSSASEPDEWLPVSAGLIGDWPLDSNRQPAEIPRNLVE